MSVEVSEVESAALDEGIARFLGVDGSTEGGVSLSDVRAKAASELTALGLLLQAALSQRGIRMPPAIQLHSPDEGHVRALGDHPATEEITELINNDTCLLKRFKEVEVLHVLLRRADLRASKQSMTCQHFNLGLTSLGCIAFFTEA